MLVKGCFWIALGAITLTVLLLFAFLVIKDKKEWCVLAINDGCDYYEEDKCCYCIDTFKYKNITDVLPDIYDSSQAQCQVLNGSLAALDKNDLALWLSKRMFFMGVEKAVVALRKISSKWYWIKPGGEKQEAVDISWRKEFLPDPENEQGILTVETVINDMGNDIYVYYNYDHYREIDKGYVWYGFTTVNTNFTNDAYYICKYDSDPCACSGTDIVLANLDDSQTIHSPQYPKNYCSDTNCRWLVSAPEGLGVQLDWLVFSLELEMDYVYILDGPDPLSPVIKECTGWKCGNQRSSTNKIQIHFHSDHVTTDLGFRARVSAVAMDACYCSQSLTIEFANLRETYSVNSPNFPRKYCESHNCQWTFVAPPSLGIHVTFKNFDLEPNHDDFLIISDHADMLINCTGSNCPGSISSSNEMSLTFSTDISESTNMGFQAIITVVENYCLQKEIRSEKRNRTEEEAWIKVEYASDVRDDGLVPVRANATVVCGNNSKIQGTDHVAFDSVTCDSPLWNREIGICIPACNVEFVNFSQNYEDMKVCKPKPPRMVESGGNLTVHHYDFIHQKEVSQHVYTCNGNQWTDRINNYSLIQCENLEEDPKILIVGGDDNGEKTDALELFYPTNPTLSKILSTKMLKQRWYHTSAMIPDGSVISCGDEHDMNMTHCERYIPRENKVHESEPLNTRRKRAASAVLNGFLFICGGSDVERDHSSCERYTPGFGWEYISPMQYERYGLCLVVYDHQLIAISGTSEDFVHRRLLDSEEAYNPATDEWSKFPTLIYYRVFPAAAVFDDKILVCGGFESTIYSYDFEPGTYYNFAQGTCEQYDPTETKWVLVAEMQLRRGSFKMVTMGSQIFALGGEGYRPIETVEMFDGHEWGHFKN